jgi:hypothetical protein
MRKIVLITFLFLAFCTCKAFGDSVCVSKAGSNTSPYETWAKAATHPDNIVGVVSASDTIFFAPGDYDTVRIEPISGTAANPTVYICSTASEASFNTTTLWSGNPLSNWVEHVVGNDTLWKTDGTPVLQAASWTSDAGPGNKWHPCVVQGDSMYWPCSALGGVTAAGRFFYNTSNDTLYIFPYSTADTNNVRISADNVLFFEDVDHTKWVGLNFKMGFNCVIQFSFNGFADSNVFEHCNIAHSVARGNNNAAMVASWATGGQYYDGNRFTACTLYSSSSGNDVPEGDFSGSGFLLYGARTWVIDSCYFYRIQGLGFYLKGATAGQTGNRVSHCVMDGAMDMPFGEDSFTGGGFQIKCNADRDSCYGNIFANFIGTTTASAIRIRPGDCGAPVNLGGHFICNNTAYNCSRFLDGYEGVGDPDTLSEIKYNVFSTVLNSASRWGQDVGNTYTDTDDYDIDSNYYYDASEAFLFFNGSNRNWTYWTTTLGWDANGYNSDPGLNDPANGDYTRPSASGEMSRNIGGITRTIYGALENAASSGPSKAPFKR